MCKHRFITTIYKDAAQFSETAPRLLFSTPRPSLRTFFTLFRFLLLSFAEGRVLFMLRVVGAALVAFSVPQAVLFRAGTFLFFFHSLSLFDMEQHLFHTLTVDLKNCYRKVFELETVSYFGEAAEVLDCPASDCRAVCFKAVLAPVNHF